MDQKVEKLLYSRRDAATALSLSVRSIDYLVASRRLISRRFGGKILIPASDLRRFARSDHAGVQSTPQASQQSAGTLPEKIEPQFERGVPAQSRRLSRP